MAYDGRRPPESGPFCTSSLSQLPTHLGQRQNVLFFRVTPSQLQWSWSGPMDRNCSMGRGPGLFRGPVGEVPTQLHFASSSGRRILTCPFSASYQQSRDSSSSEGYSESHRRERPWSSEGLLWQRGGFSTVVEEDGGILCWCDQV